MTDIKQMLASNLNDLGEIHLSAKDSAVLLTIIYDLICVERLYERIAELESDRRRLEWLVINNARLRLLHNFYHVYDSGNVCIVQMVDDWRDAIDQVM